MEQMLTLRQLRRDRSPEEIAAALGVSRNTLLNWEAGRTPMAIPPCEVPTVAQVYGINSAILLIASRLQLEHYKENKARDKKARSPKGFEEID